MEFAAATVSFRVTGSERSLLAGLLGEELWPNDAWAGGCGQMTGWRFEVPPSAGARRGREPVEFGQGLVDVMVPEAVDDGVGAVGSQRSRPRTPVC